MRCYFPNKKKCPICLKRIKENTEGDKGYCQGHVPFEIKIAEKIIRNRKLVRAERKKNGL